MMRAVQLARSVQARAAVGHRIVTAAAAGGRGGGGGWRSKVLTNHFRSITTSAYTQQSQGGGTQSQRAASVRVAREGGKLEVEWGDGHKSVYHVQWLRHNCQCPRCHSSSGQKMIGGRELLGGVRIASAATSGDTLDISWSSPMSEGGGEHKGKIGLQWLKENCYSLTARQQRQQRSTPLVTTSVPEVSAKEVMEDDKGLWNWLRYLNEYGLCLLKDVPTRMGEIKNVVERISHIQKTLYEEIFDVVAAGKSVNVAYSSQALPLHMDLVYYESPPGLQILHCIRNDPCVKGGESTLLDAFPLLEEMREKHPHHFDTLARVPATFQMIFHERPGVVEMKYQRPHVVVDSTGKITGINWTTAHEGPLNVPEEDVEPYYEAYTCLSEMIDTSDLKVAHKLNPGEALTFNNRRMLHARNDFQLNGGVRHLQGAYVNIDEFKSRFQVLCRKFDRDYPVKHVFNHCTL